VENRDNPIIIIGAGPAGLTAAYELSRGGRKVLVLEQYQHGQIGPDGHSKLCGGGLVPLSRSYLGEDIENKLENKNFIAKTGNIIARVKLDFSAVTTLDREDLINFLTHKAVKAGASVRFGAKVATIDLKDKLIMVGREKIPFFALIGADGANSIVRHALGLEKSEKFLQAVEYRVPRNKINSLLAVHFDYDLFAGGYAWVFPHKKEVYIGACEPFVTRRRKKKNLVDDLKEWIRRENLPYNSETLRGWTIPYSFQGYRFPGSVYLVGDAAGITSGFLGEGISSAIASGHDVANLIIDPSFRPVNINQSLRIKSRQEKFLAVCCRSPILGRFLIKTAVWMASTKIFLPLALWFYNLNKAEMNIDG